MSDTETVSRARFLNALRQMDVLSISVDKYKESISTLKQQLAQAQEEAASAKEELEYANEKLNGVMAENAQLQEKLRGLLEKEAARAAEAKAESTDVKEAVPTSQNDKESPKMFGVATVKTSDRLNRAMLPQKPAEKEFDTDFTLYTDGACLGNGREGYGFGGWAAVIVNNKTGAETEMSGCAGPDTTNQVMELSGVQEGLDKLMEIGEQDSTVTVCSDSQYVIKGITEWSRGWEENGWRNSAGNPVKNQAIWKGLLDTLRTCGMSIGFKWTKGHADHYYNSLCDLLATTAAAEKARECNCHEFEENIPTY